MTQPTLSAGQSGIGFKRAERHRGAPAHLGAPIAAKPRITQSMDPTRFLPEHLLENRLTAVIEAGTSTSSSHGEVVCSEGS